MEQLTYICGVLLVLVLFFHSHNNKRQLMATIADFQAQLDRANTAIDAVTTEINNLKGQLSNTGLTPDEQSQVLTSLTQLGDKLEAAVTSPTT